MEEESKTKFSMNVEFSFAFKKQGNFRKIPLVRPQGKRYNEMYGI